MPKCYYNELTKEELTEFVDVQNKPIKPGDEVFYWDNFHNSIIRGFVSHVTQSYNLRIIKQGNIIPDKTVYNHNIKHHVVCL